MCRKIILYGSILAAFGSGLLIGAMIASEFFQTLIGIVLIGLGVFVLLK